MYKFFKQLLTNLKPAQTPTQKILPEQTVSCCSNEVIIAYRGLSDFRQYIAYNRQYADIKYFKQHFLKVFCARCRKRINYD